MIKLWKDRYHELQSSRQHKAIFQYMQDELQKEGFSVTLQQIKAKIHNFTRKYREEQKHKSSKWPLFKEVQSIIDPFAEFNDGDRSEDDSSDLSDFDSQNERKSIANCGTEPLPLHSDSSVSNDQDESLFTGLDKTDHLNAFKLRLVWGPKSEDLLIDLWEERAEDYRRSKSLSHIHDAIAKNLCAKGFPFTAPQVDKKMKELITQYGGENRISNTWRHYQRLQAILNEDDDAETENETNMELEVEATTLLCDNEDSDTKGCEPVSSSNIRMEPSAENSDHVATSDYIRSLLCSLPFEVAQQFSFDFIAKCQTEILNQRETK